MEKCNVENSLTGMLEFFNPPRWYLPSSRLQVIHWRTCFARSNAHLFVKSKFIRGGREGPKEEKMGSRDVASQPIDLLILGIFSR